MNKTEFRAYLRTMLSGTQIKVLCLCLKQGNPVCVYGTGLGKSTLVSVLRRADFDAVYAPEECHFGEGPFAVSDMAGAVALHIKKEPFDRCLSASSFSTTRDVIQSVISDVLAHVH